MFWRCHSGNWNTVYCCFTHWSVDGFIEILDDAQITLNCYTYFLKLILTEEPDDYLTLETNTYENFPVCVLFVILPAQDCQDIEWIFEKLKCSKFNRLIKNIIFLYSNNSQVNNIMLFIYFVSFLYKNTLYSLQPLPVMQLFHFENIANVHQSIQQPLPVMQLFHFENFANGHWSIHNCNL